jgi:hypothetical protein
VGRRSPFEITCEFAGSIVSDFIGVAGLIDVLQSLGRHLWQEAQRAAAARRQSVSLPGGAARTARAAKLTAVNLGHHG